MLRIFKKLADSHDPGSLAARLRKKRFALFESLLESVPPPLTILDIGGEPVFWEGMGFAGKKGVEIWLLNLIEVQPIYPNFHSIIGDGRNLKQFKDSEFDIVFSNSVIEHIEKYEDQCLMAGEMIRVGKRYYLQTPNRYFPVEPHFLFPFFQFLPLRCRVWLLSRFNLGWFKKREWEKALRAVKSIRLLNKKELIRIFPAGTVFREKFFGLTKSLIVYGGWDKK